MIVLKLGSSYGMRGCARNASPSGIAWTARAAAEPGPWRSVTYGNGKFVAMAGGGTDFQVMLAPWTP